MKIYTGVSISGNAQFTAFRVIFRSNTVPTHESHGHLFKAVLGPFNTMRAAKAWKYFGYTNPHFTCVSEIEKHAKNLSWELSKLPTEEMKF